MEESNCFLIALVSRNENRLQRLLIQSQVVLLQAVRETPRVDVADPVKQIRLSAAGQRNLVVRITVAVGVLLLKGLQHFVPLVHGGGHFQTQTIQPCLVDKGRIAALRTQRLLTGQSIDMAVRIGNHLTHSGLCLPSRLDVGAILFYIFFQRNEHVKVGGNVIILQSIVSEEYVGQITAGQQERLLLRPVRIACVLPVDLDVGVLFHLLEHGVVFKIHRIGAFDVKES